MIEELQVRFRGQLVTVARERLERVQLALSNTGGAAIAENELHSLAGEAAMLAFSEIATHARSGEQAARRWCGGDVEARHECERTLTALVALVEGL